MAGIPEDAIARRAQYERAQTALRAQAVVESLEADPARIEDARAAREAADVVTQELAPGRGRGAARSAAAKLKHPARGRGRAGHEAVLAAMQPAIEAEGAAA